MLTTGRSRARGRARSDLQRWNPLRLQGCALWLRADLGVTLNGSTVSAWANQGTAGGSFTQGTGTAQPTYSASGGPNSRSTLTFDGNDKIQSSLAAASWNFLHSGNATWFLVFRSTTSADAYHSIFSTSDTTTGSRGYALGWDNRSSLTRSAALSTLATTGSAYAYSLATSNASYPTNTWSIAEQTVDYLASGNDLNVFANGTSVLSSELSNAPSSSNAASTLWIGMLLGSSLGFVGGISEIIAFNRTLTAAERAVVRRYLGSYYAITVA